MYADNTTLTTTLNSNISNEATINVALDDINTWLKLNKLSLNVKKSKYMIFHMKMKQFIKPKLIIENTELELVENFNFLGLTIDQHLNWKAHTSKVA